MDEARKEASDEAREEDKVLVRVDRAFERT